MDLLRRERLEAGTMEGKREGERKKKKKEKKERRSKVEEVEN